MRERNEALDCYVYARAAASSVGLDRFEERHWRELEKQLGLARPPDPEVNVTSSNLSTDSIDASPTDPGRAGISASGQPKSGRRVIRSPWLKR